MFCDTSESRLISKTTHTLFMTQTNFDVLFSRLSHNSRSVNYLSNKIQMRMQRCKHQNRQWASSFGRNQNHTFSTNHSADSHHHHCSSNVEAFNWSFIVVKHMFKIESARFFVWTTNSMEKRAYDLKPPDAEKKIQPKLAMETHISTESRQNNLHISGK